MPDVSGWLDWLGLLVWSLIASLSKIIAGGVVPTLLVILSVLVVVGLYRRQHPRPAPLPLGRVLWATVFVLLCWAAVASLAYWLFTLEPALEAATGTEKIVLPAGVPWWQGWVVFDWLIPTLIVFGIPVGIGHAFRKAAWALKWGKPLRNGALGLMALAVAAGGWRHYEGDPLSRGSVGVSRGDVAAIVGVPLVSQPEKLWRGGVPPNSESTDFLPVMGRLWPKIVSASGPYKIRCVYANGQDMLVERDNCPREGLVRKKPVNPANSTLYFTYGWEL